MTRSQTIFLIVSAVAVLGFFSFSSELLSQNGDAPLPDRGVAIDVDSPEKSLYRIAVPNLNGPTGLGSDSAAVLRKDFELVSLFDVLDIRSFVGSSESKGIRPSAWRSVGAQGVIKGKLEEVNGRWVAKMHFYEVAKGESARLSKAYEGDRAAIRGWMHDFANEVLKALTGQRGAFGSRLLFARRLARGRKDVFVAGFDGKGLNRISSGKGISMLPSFGAGGVWYSRLSEEGMFITNNRVDGKPVIQGDGLSMSPVPCGGRILFTSTRTGNSEIFSAKPDGSDVRQLTKHPAIDVSPACGPKGQIAFVSTRHGGPQIFVMNQKGGGARRVTFRGAHNQTPAWCPDPKRNLLAFTGRGDGFDIFTVDIDTQEYTRLTQGQGTNKDPAFSADCRMVAFYSSRGGVFISNPQGLNQQMVIRGHAETLRWSK